MWHGKMKGATDMGLLLLGGGILLALFFSGAFTQTGAGIGQPPVAGTCTAAELPPGTSTLSFTDTGKERGTPSTLVTWTFTGEIGKRGFTAQSGGTAVTVNPGDTIEARATSTGYHDVYQKKRLACAASDDLSMDGADVGGVSVAVRNNLNGSVNSGTNATCQAVSAAGGTLSLNINAIGNESKSYFTLPSDMGTPGYSDGYVAILEIPSGSAVAYAGNNDAIPTSLTGATSRSGRIGGPITAGSKALIWDVPGNVGLGSAGAADSKEMLLTLQATTGYTPHNCPGQCQSAGLDTNGTLMFYLFPKDVFRDSNTGQYKTDFEDNAGSLTANAQGFVQAISVC